MQWLTARRIFRLIPFKEYLLERDLAAAWSREESSVPTKHGKQRKSNRVQRRARKGIRRSLRNRPVLEPNAAGIDIGA